MNIAQFKAKVTAQFMSQQVMIEKRRKEFAKGNLLDKGLETLFESIEADNQRLKNFLDNSDDYHVKYHGTSTMKDDVYTIIEKESGVRHAVVTFPA